jgi:hypothetical protein
VSDAAPRERGQRELPILFSGPMVRAILSDTKTQTRRVMKPQPHDDFSPVAVEFYHPTRISNGEEVPGPQRFGAYDDECGFVCPYGGPGDRLWVRETWTAYEDPDQYGDSDPLEGPPSLMQEEYGATINNVVWRADGDETHQGYWRPAIHMPRWASRITLNVVSVRVERLQDISEADAKAEGVERVGDRWRNYMRERESQGINETVRTARESFFSLWESIHGTESLAANPWVWRIEFWRVA